VVLQHKIYVYNFADLSLISHIETLANPKGAVCAWMGVNGCGSMGAVKFRVGCGQACAACPRVARILC
jgi:hypothetical protein